MFTDIVILAGGFGERLWPASKADFPKQFMTLEDDISFLQHSILRGLELMPKGKIIIATRLGLEKQIAIQVNKLLEKLDSEKYTKLKKDILIISEPFAKHTSAPILFSSILAKKFDTSYEHSILVLTSDHIIEPMIQFVKDAEKAFISAQKNHIVTFGITPEFPSTGYGYIITEKEEENNNNVYKIKEFKEKPDIDTAKKYIETGNCKWNSGMFAFNCNFFEQEIKKLSPEIFNPFIEIINSNLPKVEKIDGIDYIKPYEQMTNAYTKVPSIAIDKSLAEKTTQAYCVSSSFNWDDVGSWDSFEKHCSNKNKNKTEIESNNCFVYSDIPVAICGIDNISVIIKNGKALVMKKGCSNLVRQAAQNDKN